MFCGHCLVEIGVALLTVFGAFKCGIINFIQILIKRIFQL